MPFADWPNGGNDYIGESSPNNVSSAKTGSMATTRRPMRLRRGLKILETGSGPAHFFTEIATNTAMLLKGDTKIYMDFIALLKLKPKQSGQP